MIFSFSSAASSQNELKYFFKIEVGLKKNSIPFLHPKRHTVTLCGLCANSGEVERVPETLGVRRRPLKWHAWKRMLHVVCCAERLPIFRSLTITNITPRNRLRADGQGIFSYHGGSVGWYAVYARSVSWLGRHETTRNRIKLYLKVWPYTSTHTSSAPSHVAAKDAANYDVWNEQRCHL